MIACGDLYTVIQNEKNEIYVCGKKWRNHKDIYNFEKVKYNFGEIKNIVCGPDNIIVQNKKNEIYVCGRNCSGQLGLGDYYDRNKFEKVKYDFGGIKNIVCGEYHVIIQNGKNEIYVCGANWNGQLGLDDSKHRNTFEKIDFNFGGIKNIAYGLNHTIIQNVKNEIYVCGGNHYGQLDLGDNEIRKKFKKVEYNFGKIKNIACGSNHTIIQNEKNEVYVCGHNEYGQLGLGDYKDRNKFEKVEHDFGKIKKITCGGDHTVIQNEKNEVYVCGWNKSGQLGLGDNKRKNKFKKVEYNFGEIKNIACGSYHTIIQNEKNEIHVCGNNYHGQLGLGDYKHRNTIEKVNTDDIFEKIYNFELEFNMGEIVL